MSTAAPSRRPMDPAVVVARDKEDVLYRTRVVAGDRFEIITRTAGKR